MTRKPLRLCIAAALFTPLGALALGLGPIQLRSALNEPLNAEIPVSTSHGGELDNLSVGLASRDAFQQAGIDRPTVLTGLEFELVKRPDGSALIRVSSQRPIREPILNFLVALEGNRSRLVREFAVFLDPPGFRGRSVSLPVAQTPAAPRQPAPPPPADFQAALEPGSGQSYGPVASGETLWRIADRVRPAGISVQRMINALFEANPQAFLRSDPNTLMAGAMLQVPDPRQIAALDGGPLPAGATAQAPPPGPAAATPAPVEAGPAGQLRLLSPEGEAGAPVGEAPGGLAATGGQPQTPEPLPGDPNESVQESPTTVGQALVTALPALDEAYLIAVRDQGLVGLKLTGMEDLRQRIADLESSNPESLTPESPAPAAPAQPQPQPQAQAQAQVQGTPAAAPAASPPAPPARTISVPPPPQTGWVDELFELLGKPFTLILAGLVLVLLLLLLLWRRRRSRDEEPAEPVQFTAVAVDDKPAPAPVRTAASASRPPPLTVESPLERADLLIAVGNTAEAAHILRVALTGEPGNTALAAKLLEVHFAAGDAEAFIETAEDLRQRLDGDDPLWLHVREMGAELAPAHALFGGKGAHSPVLTPERPAQTRQPPAPPVESMDDLGLDLDWSGLEAAQDQTPTPKSREPERLELPPAATAQGPAAEADGALPWDVADLQEFRRSREPRQPDSPAPTPKRDEEEDFFSAALAELDWDSTPRKAAPPSPKPPAPAPAPEKPSSSLDFELEDFSEPKAPQEPPAAAAGPAAGELASGQPGESAPETPPVADDYVETKLDLALAYLDMEDPVGARSLLEEVAQEGSRQQKQRADELLRKLG